MSDAHRIRIIPMERKLEIFVGDTKIGQSDRALSLIENPLPPVYYVPRDDVKAEFLLDSSHKTHCPFKGDASYFTLKIGQLKLENAVWSYEKPIASVAQIKGFLAFDERKVQTKVTL